MPYLRQSLNGTTINVYELQESCLIGRSAADCAIIVDDPTVSAQHARVSNTADGWVLEDLNSTNGVFVRGNRVDFVNLIESERVSIGTHDLEFTKALPSDLDKTLKIKKSWIPGVYYTE